jgi:putative hemolysin
MAAMTTPTLARSSRPGPPPREAQPTRRLDTSWASSEADVRAAQRLRWRVFAIEMGARLEPPPGTPPGHDVDRFDDHCEHVLVRASTPDGAGEVIGTYRVLTPDAARRAGGCYSEHEFDMSALRDWRPRMLELGRSCIDPAWRTGGAILMLWSAIGELMLRLRLDIVFGAVSVGLADGGRQAACVWHRLAASHLAPLERRVRPLRPLPLPSPSSGPVGDGEIDMPPLVKGYVRCGAQLLGAPAWDPDFGCADLPMLMPLAGLPQRHRRHFLGAGEADETP